MLEVRRTGSGDCEILFQPELSLRAEVQSVELNGRPLPFKLETNSSDQHLTVRFKAYGGPSTVRVKMRDDFSVSYTSRLPELASGSEGLRILSQAWSSAHDALWKWKDRRDRRTRWQCSMAHRSPAWKAVSLQRPATARNAYGGIAGKRSGCDGARHVNDSSRKQIGATLTRNRKAVAEVELVSLGSRYSECREDLRLVRSQAERFLTPQTPFGMTNY